MYKVAVIGLGYLGRFHVEKYVKSKRGELVAVVDIDEEKAKKFGKKYRVPYFTDYRALAGLKLHCASVVSDTSTHCEIGAFLLQHGIDVLMEKPIAVSVEEARRLIELARVNNRVLQVGHLERFNPAFLALRNVLTNPWFLEVRRIAPFSGRGGDVDVVRDLMIHDIDIVSHLVEKPIERLEAVGIPVLTNTIDIANARLTFEGGAIANVTASRAAFVTERTIRIFQPDLYISLDLGKRTLKISKKASDPRKTIPEVQVFQYPIVDRDALEQELDSFLFCVERRTKPVVSGEDGLRALEIAERIHRAIYESSQRMSEEERRLIAANG